MDNEKKLVVVALGRNAFGKTIPKQKENVRLAAEKIAEIVEAGCRVVVTHLSLIHISEPTRPY